MLPRLAAWCYRRRRLVVVAWIVVLVGVNVLAKSEGGDLLKSLSLPGTESQRAFDVMKNDFAQPGDTGYLVFKSNTSDGVQSPAVFDEIEKTLAPALRHEQHVLSVVTPYEPGGAGFFAKDGKIAYAEIQFDVQANDVPVALASHMRDVVKKANTSSLQVELGGSMFTDQTQPASEAIGILAAVFILLLAFGSVLAMGLPIMTALFGIGIGLAIVTLLARFTDVPSFAPQVTAMIGIDRNAGSALIRRVVT